VEGCDSVCWLAVEGCGCGHVWCAQVGTLSDHNEELMKLKHAGPWSELTLVVWTSVVVFVPKKKEFNIKKHPPVAFFHCAVSFLQMLLKGWDQVEARVVGSLFPSDLAFKDLGRATNTIALDDKTDHTFHAHFF